MDIRRKVIHMHHDLPSAGHQDCWKTYKLVTRNYWWPGISNDVKKYVTGCDICQRMKNRPQQPYGPLLPNPVLGSPWEIITVDLITGLPESQGYNAIMVVVDRLSKLVHALPTNDTVTSEGIARLFRDQVWKHHGLPLQMISDRGP